MVATATVCTICGHKFRSTGSTGQLVRCPACLNQFMNDQQAVPSLLAGASPPAVQGPMATPPNRTMLAESEAMVRYKCPRCKKSLESPASFAGQKLNCPDCKQRIQIPPPKVADSPLVNKTMLASEEIPQVVFHPVPAPPVPPVPTLQVAVVEETNSRPDRAAAQRECCLECGKDVSNRSQLQTCPDCGSSFCSAMCYREHRHHSHEPAPAPKRKQFVECVRCGSSARPYRSTVISQGGWIVFALLLIFFFPLFWIGLLMTETHEKCFDCGARLN
jgi:DNA-directed RNA polymerase subunit RPC12/RpoP